MTEEASSFDVAEELDVIRTDLTTLESLLDAETWNRRVESVSYWSVAQQVDHTLRALGRSLGASLAIHAGDDIVEPAPAEPPRGLAILRGGRIPRGRADAIVTVIPEPEPQRDDVRERLARVRDRLQAVSGVGADLASVSGAIAHPILGAFGAVEWLRFARVHTRHHLDIIRDILAA